MREPTTDEPSALSDLPVSGERFKLERMMNTQYEVTPPLEPIAENASALCTLAFGGGPFLPPWPHDKQILSSVAFRQALFPAICREKRPFVMHVDLVTVGSVQVRFSGERFDQSDLDVLMELINTLQETPHQVECSAQDVLAALNKSVSGAAYAWLQLVITRLMLGVIEIITPEHTYLGHLVEGAARDEANQRYRIRLNPELIRLFQDDGASFKREQRRALKSPTARAIHAYLSAHRNPGRHTLGTLASVAGMSDNHAMSTISKALDELQEVGFLRYWHLVQDTVTLVLAAASDCSSGLEDRPHDH